MAAGDRLFREQGFHDTSLDQVASAAGYTKGAVYSNFASKEDLFLAIFERRVEEALEHVARVLEALGEQGPAELTRRNLAAPDRGWMAVFFEFWAHVLRNPESRVRFLALHRRAQEPLVATPASGSGPTARLMPRAGRSPTWRWSTDCSWNS